MPTGYTAPVEDGTISELAPFAQRCARAFLVREERLSNELPENLEVGLYYVQAVDVARVKVEQLESMTDEKADIEAVREHDLSATFSAEYVAESKAKVERYRSMILKVDAWKCPEACRELRQFMLRQLYDSFDPHEACGPKVAPLLTGPEWRTQRLSDARETLSRCEGALAKEQERCDAANKWIAELRASL
jgi:hypothetical protein